MNSSLDYYFHIIKEFTMKRNQLPSNFFCLLIFLINFSFFACSKDQDEADHKPSNTEWIEIEKEIVPNPMDAYIPLDKEDIGRPKLLLGYGYDVMGVIASYSSIKAQVIDIDKMQESFTWEAFSIWNKSEATAGSIYGNNKSEYIRKMSPYFLEINLYSNEELQGKVLHTKTFDGYKFLDPHQEYTYCSEHNYHIHFESVLNYSPSKWFLTDSFAEDLNLLKPEEIVEKYGTHILARYQSGARFDMLYMAKIYPRQVAVGKDTITFSVDKQEILKTGRYKVRSETQTGFMQGEFLPENFDELVSKNINPILYFNTVGGPQGIVPCGFYNLEKDYPKSKQTEWYAALRDNKNDDIYEMVTISELLPIYICISDPTKKAEIKQAVLDYIDKHQP